MSSLAEDITAFLRSREKTLAVLIDINDEISKLGKNVKITNMVTRGISVTSGIVSVGLLVATPFTGGLSAAGSIALAGVSGAAAVTSVGASFVQRTKEKGLMKNVRKILEDDLKATEKLKIAATILRDAGTTAKASAVGICQIAKVGVQAAEQIDVAVQSAMSAKVLAVATRATVVAEKVGKVLRVTGGALLIASIPLDIIAFIKDAIDTSNGNYSEVAKWMQNTIRQLVREYDEIKKLL